MNMIWASQLGGDGDEYGRSIAADTIGNIYTTGHFLGTVDLDPGPGLASFGTTGADDCFVTKMDPNGNLIWAVSFGGTGGDFARSIAVDLEGSIFISGNFAGSCDFDPGNLTYVLNSTGQNDIFLLKLNSSGGFLWAHRIGGIGDDYGRAIVLDSLGFIYHTGYFEDTIDFDPDTSSVILSTAGQADIFVYKTNTTGNILWAKSMGGTRNDYGRAIAIDKLGNVFTTGHFRGTADFDPGTGVFLRTSVGLSDFFVSKLNSSGNFVWVRRMGGPGNDYGRGIGLDNTGHVYTTGYFEDTCDFRPGTGIYNLISIGLSDIFVQKMNNAGQFHWARSWGGIGDDLGRAISIDNLSNVYTTGQFADVVDFDPNAGTYNLVSTGQDDTFLSQLDSAGIFACAIHFEGLASDNGSHLTIDKEQNIVVTGYFSQSVDFDPTSGAYPLDSPTILNDIYIVKLSPCLVILPIELEYFSGQTGPISNELKWKTNSEFNNAFFVIERSFDMQSFAALGSISGQGVTMESHEYSFADNDPSSGINYYRLQQVDFNGQSEYSEIIALDRSNEHSLISIFPNPSSDKLSILNVPLDFVSMCILNEYGSAIQTYKCPITEIDVSSFRNGIYFIQFSDKYGNVIYKRITVVK
ncbi:MAG: SBBP repeat-containing protein [Flavobacteriales bacterium]